MRLSDCSAQGSGDRGLAQENRICAAARPYRRSKPGRAQAIERGRPQRSTPKRGIPPRNSYSTEGFKYYHYVNAVLQKAMPQRKQIANLCRNTLQ